MFATPPLRRSLLVILMTCFAMAATAQRALGEDLTGQLLVATPELGDSNFKHTVIFMVSHGENGA